MSRFLMYAVGLLILAADQLTKFAAVRLLPAGESRPLLGAYLSLTVQRNTGAAFGMFPAATTALIALAAIIIIFIAVWGPQMAQSNRLLAVGLAMTLGGATGNLIDRLRLGYVLDFLDLHFWPVFNVADIGITCGAILVVIALFLRTRTNQSDTHTKTQPAPPGHSNGPGKGS
ncbi:MAG: signal peptidase II [Armatimonadetes bacterium]|nr:signal peptidase II [Armatimonadota bacterium]